MSFRISNTEFKITVGGQQNTVNAAFDKTLFVPARQASRNPASHQYSRKHQIINCRRFNRGCVDFPL